MLYLIVNKKKTPPHIAKDIHEKIMQLWDIHTLSVLNFTHFIYKHYNVYKSYYHDKKTLNLFINIDEQDQSEIAELYKDDNTQWVYNRYFGSKTITNIKRHDSAIIAQPKDLISAIFDFFSYYNYLSLLCVDVCDYLSATGNKILYYHQTNDLTFNVKLEGKTYNQSSIIKHFNLALFIFKVYEIETDSITMDDLNNGCDKVTNKWPDANLANMKFMFAIDAPSTMNRYALYWEVNSSFKTNSHKY